MCVWQRKSLCSVHAHPKKHKIFTFRNRQLLMICQAWKACGEALLEISEVLFDYTLITEHLEEDKNFSNLFSFNTLTLYSYQKQFFFFCPFNLTVNTLFLMFCLHWYVLSLNCLLYPIQIFAKQPSANECIVCYIGKSLINTSSPRIHLSSPSVFTSSRSKAKLGWNLSG